MDYNHNGSNDQNHDNQQWVRWDSNASHSSYYNQPTHRPYGQRFALASGICGILSLSTCCFVVVSLPLAALGVLFAVLAWRKGRKMSNTWVAGVLFSCIGLTCAVSLLIYSLAMMPILLKNEAFRSQFDRMTEQMYGMDFAEFLEEFYGYSIEK